jgi:hypothetical protein
MAKPEKRKKARELRKKGWATGRIAKELNVSKGSVSSWTHDIELTPEQEATLKANRVHWGAQNKGAQTNKRRALAQRKLYQQAGRKRAKNGSRLHFGGCMLYWAEGGKTLRHRVHFANSDPAMLKLFLKFLREELDVSDNMVKLQIHCHTDDKSEVSRIEQYWINLLDLVDNTCLYKTQYKQGTSSRKNRLMNGIFSITIQSTEIVQHIFGAIQEYGGFENEDWLF